MCVQTQVRVCVRVYVRTIHVGDTDALQDGNEHDVPAAGIRVHQLQ